MYTYTHTNRRACTNRPAARAQGQSIRLLLLLRMRTCEHILITGVHEHRRGSIRILTSIRVLTSISILTPLHLYVYLHRCVYSYVHIYLYTGVQCEHRGWSAGRAGLDRRKTRRKARTQRLTSCTRSTPTRSSYALSVASFTIRICFCTLCTARSAMPLARESPTGLLSRMVSPPRMSATRRTLPMALYTLGAVVT